MSWPRREHGDLEQISPNVWRVEGPVPGMLGVRRQMVVARDSAGRLLVHSAIALDERRMVEMQKLGTLTWLVVPGGYHRLDAPAFKSRFPQLTVISPRGAIARVRKSVGVDLIVGLALITFKSRGSRGVCWCRTATNFERGCSSLLSSSSSRRSFLGMVIR